MKIIYVVYILAGGGIATTAWGGPALVTVPDKATCVALADTMREQEGVYHSVCVEVVQ